MAAFAAITCSEFGRQWCLWFSALLHVALLGGGATMVVIALYIEGTYPEYMSLIGFKVGYTPLLLQVFGGVGILFGFGAFFMMIVSLYPTSRKNMRLPMLYYTILLWAPTIGHIVMLVMTARDHGKLTSKNGVVVGMEYTEPFAVSLQAYKDKIETKASIDLMQQTFECCGNADYRDWFQIQWYSDESFNHLSMAVEQHMKGGRLVLQDVPFSCCDPTVKRPCIHHQVYNNKIHFNYDYQKDLTLYKDGCRERMLERYDQTLTTMVLPVEGGMLGLYVVILLLVKYLQTSMASAMLLGDPEVSAPGYIFQFKGDGRADEKLAEKLEKDKLEKDEAEERLKAAKERVLERIKKKKEEKEEEEGEDGEKKKKKKKKKRNEAGEEVDDDDDDDGDENNNARNESTNNGLFARILRKISSLRRQHSDSSSSETDTSSSSSGSGTSSTSNTSNTSNTSSTATKSSTTNCTSPADESLPLSPIKHTSDATCTPVAQGPDGQASPQPDSTKLVGGVPIKPAAGRVVISGPRSELKNPRLLEVIRAIARLHASTPPPDRLGDDKGGIHRPNCSGNAGGLEVQSISSTSSVYSSSSGDVSSSTASSSRATTVRFGGSETTTFISDSGSSSGATSRSTSRSATSSGTGTTTTTKGTGGSGTDSTTGTTTTGTTTDTTGATTDTTGSPTATTGATTETTGLTSATTGSTSATTGSTSATTGSTSATTGSTSATTGSTSATTGSTSATTGSTSATTGSTSATTGSTSATTGSTSVTTGSTSATTGSTSATTGSTSTTAGSTTDTTGSTTATTGCTTDTTGATTATTGSTSATTGSTSATTGSTSATTGSTSATTGSTTATTSATGAGTSSTKVTTVTGSSTGSSLTDSKTGTSAGTGTSGATTSATGTTVTGSATSISISSESGSSSRIIGSETGRSSSSATSSQLSRLSTKAVTTGSHIVANVAMDRCPKHRSAYPSADPSLRRVSKEHRSSSSHHHKRSSPHTNEGQTDEKHVIPLPLPSPPGSRAHDLSSGQGGSDHRSKQAAKHHVYDEIAPYSVGSPHPVLLKSGQRHRPVTNDALVTGEDPHAQRGVAEDYHVYEEVPYHVYQEIQDLPDDQKNQTGGRLYSDLSVQFIPVEGRTSEETSHVERRRSASTRKPEGQRVYEEIPIGGHTYKNRPIPNVPVEEHIYEEIPFGHHVYKNRQNIPVAAHIYEEIPFGHHAYKNHPLPNVPVVEYIYEEIPYGHHLYKNRPLPNIPEEEHTYEEIPYGYHLYRDRLLPNIPEEEHIYEEIPSGHHLHKHRHRDHVAVDKLAHGKSAAGRKETKSHRVGNVRAMETAYEDIPFEDHVYGNVAAPSVQDQQSGYLLPERQTADRIDPNVPNQQRVTTEPMSRRQGPRLSRSVGASPQQVYDVQGTPNDQRCPVSNPELVNFLGYRNLPTARSESFSSSSRTGQQDSGSESRSYSDAVSRSSGSDSVSSNATPQSVPNTPAHQGLSGEQHDARQAVQSIEPAYTGLGGPRSDYSYTSLGVRPSQTDTSSGNTQTQTIAASATYDRRLSETGSGRPRLAPKEPIYAELQDRRSRHVYTAVGPSPSHSDAGSASSTSQTSPSKQTYEGPAGTGFGRPKATQSEPAYIGLQGRPSEHTYTAVGSMPSRTDTTGLSQTVLGEPTPQGPGDVSRRASSSSHSRTRGIGSAESATKLTGQAPNQHLYANAVPQAPPQAAPSAGSAESVQRLARPSRSQSRHERQDDVAVSLQSSQSQPHYQPIRREDSGQSPRKQTSFQVQLQLTKSPKHSSAFVAGKTSSETPASLSPSQPQLLQQIRSDHSGQSLASNQSHNRDQKPQIGTPSKHSSTPNTSQTSSGVPVSVGSSRSQPQQANPQRAKHGGSSRHNRPPVPPKTTVTKQLAKQILSSRSASPMSSNRSPNRRTSPQRVITGPSDDHRKRPLVPLVPIAVQQTGKEASLDGPGNSVSNLANRQQPDFRPIRTGDVEHHKRPLVPPRPSAVQPTASQTTSSGPRNEVSDQPQRHPNYDQTRPENLAIIQGLTKQAAMSSQYIMDSPVAAVHQRSSSSNPVQLQPSSSQVDEDVDRGNAVPPHSSRNHSGRSSPNLRFQGVPNDPSSEGQDARVRPPWVHHQRPLVPPKPTKAQPQHDDDKSLFRAKLEGIYARAATSEPTHNNYRSALNLARAGNAAENGAESKTQVETPSRQKSTEKTSQASSSASQTLQATQPAPVPPPPPPPALKLPIKGILVKRNDSGGSSRNPSPSESLGSSTHSTHSELMDTQVVDRRLAVRT